MGISGWITEWFCSANTLVNSEGHLKEENSDTDSVLVTHTFMRSKGAEINRNEILVYLHHICCDFLILDPHSLPLLWSEGSLTLVLLTFPQTKKIHFGYAWNAVWCPQTGNSLPIYMLSVGLEFHRLVQAMAGAPGLSICWSFATIAPSSLPPNHLHAPAWLINQPGGLCWMFIPMFEKSHHPLLSV